jgi:hypothetical protein
MVCVRQTHSSPISTANLKMHLEDIGNILFDDATRSPVHRQNREGNNKVHYKPCYFCICSFLLHCLMK